VKPAPITPDQVRSILGIPVGDPVGNTTAFMVRWQRMVIEREYGSLTIHVMGGREVRWSENIEHKEAP